MSTIFTWPNGLSLLRILLTPIFVYLLRRGLVDSAGPLYVLWALIVFTVAALTDTFDGYYARNNNATTSLGAFLDPLADKVLVLSTFCMFWYLNLVSIWVLIIQIGRDIVMTAVRVLFAYQKNALVTSHFARWKTCIQFIVLYALFLYALTCNYLPRWADHYMFGLLQGLTWFMACISIATVIDYMLMRIQSSRHQSSSL